MSDESVEDSVTALNDSLSEVVSFKLITNWAMKGGAAGRGCHMKSYNESQQLNSSTKCSPSSPLAKGTCHGYFKEVTFGITLQLITKSYQK